MGDRTQPRTIRTERFGPKDSIAQVLLDRPERFNAFDEAMVADLDRAVREVIEDPALRVILITGSGKAFCAGADIGAMHARTSGTYELFRALTRHLHGAIVELRRTDRPVITAINGPAAGGGYGLALCGDVRIASDRATFTSAYHTLGAGPDGGLTYFLPRYVGAGRATDLIFSDRRLTAHEALHLGIVSEVVAHDELIVRARARAEELAAGPTFAMGKSKILLNASWENALERHLELERSFNNLSAKGPELQEGIAAFVAKRPPRFSRDE